MANLLDLPLPATESVALREPLLRHLHDSFPDIDAHIFERDIEAWALLRETCIHASSATSSLSSWYQYATQLTFLLRILGEQVGVAFPWSHDSSTSSLQRDPRLAWEYTHVHLRIAAAYAQGGASESRGTVDSVKRAAHHFQLAAGCLTAAQPMAVAEYGALFTCYSALMLAQAQECFWQKAVQDGLKDTTIAKLSRSVSDLYASCVASASLASAYLPRGWIHHMEYKQHHFAAAAEYRKSCDDLAQRRYADELARLHAAAASVQRARQLPARTLPLPAIVKDLEPLQRIIDTNLARAERDNELIYLQVPTSASQLPPIGTAVLVKDTRPPELGEASKTDDSATPYWFVRLITYGIDVAVRLYKDRQAQFLLTTLEPLAMEKDTALSEQLQSMHVTETLDRIESPRRMPERWQSYMDVLSAHPVTEVEHRLRQVEDLGSLCSDLLHEVESLLWTPPVPSHATSLQTLWKEYERTMGQASVSDADVRAKLQPALPVLRKLAQGRTALHEWLNAVALPLERERTACALDLRALRRACEKADDIKAQSREIVWRARAQADTDDIRQRLLDVARERHLVEPTTTSARRVDPAALDDVLQEAMAKYDVYLDEMRHHGERQAEVLAEIRRAHTKLLRHAALAEALDAQAAAWQHIDEAYDTWRDVCTHAEEGYAFYEQLFSMLQQLRSDAAALRGGTWEGGVIQFA